MTEPFAARRARALEAVGDQGAEVFLASDIGTIRWLTGLVLRGIPVPDRPSGN